MQYKILDNGTAVIITRQPQLIEDELRVEFLGAPPGATAIFETKDGNSYYRSLFDGLCSLSVAKLSETIKVTVALLNGEIPTRKWICEEIKVDNRGNGGVLVAPNDMNLPQTVVELRLEIQELGAAHKQLKKLYEELNDKLEKIMEGYDFT